MANDISIVWNEDLAYAVGLITSDGCLSNDGRHINLTSKDIDQLSNFAKILNINNTIGTKKSGHFNNKLYYQIQFGSVSFYKFLISIGLTPNKSKTIGCIKIPQEYFIDFLRGSLDGDGFTYSYFDKRWKNSFMLYTGFVSASRAHLEWIKDQIAFLYGVNGHILYKNKVFSLTYAKNASLILLKKIYYKKDLVCLKRKRLKIKASLGIIARQAGVVELVDS